MATTINTGTVAQSGSKLYVMGTASEIDTSALVDAAYQQKVAKADTIDIRIEENQAEISAYKTLQDLGNSLTSALTSLKASYGYSTDDTSVYSNMTAYLSSSDGTDPTSLISADVESTAEKGSYSLEVIQLAKAMKVASGTVASKTDDLGMTGTFSLSLGSGSSVDISVTADMSLQELATAINQTSSQSGVSASIIKTSENSYSMVLTGTRTGETINFSHVAGDNVFQDLGIVDGSNQFSSVVQAAQSAIVEMDGIQITSLDNTLEDIVEGVTLTLYAAQENTTITLEIDKNYSATKDAIVAFVDAYNSLRDFVIQNQQVGTDGAVAEDAALYSNPILKSLNNQISSILTSIFGSGEAINNLGDLGITLDSSNKLTISDETKLNNALLNNYDVVQSFFQTSVTSDNSNITLLRNTSSISSLDITLDIQTDGSGAITSVSANGDSNAFEISGTRLVGKSGTIYEGMTFAYVGTDNATINLSINQGLADRLYNAVDSYTNKTTGIIQDNILNIESANTQLDTEADRIRERANAFREKEVARYATMETKVQAAKNLLATIRALLGTSDDE